MGQFKPMVKMETTEPSVELKLKKGGHVNMKKGGMAKGGHKKMAGGGAMEMLGMTPALVGRPAVNAPVKSPGKPSMSARRKAMAAKKPAMPKKRSMPMMPMPKSKDMGMMPPMMPSDMPPMKKGGKADKSQDKAMIKKAFKQHDAQEHKGGKGTKLALKKGGKMATGGVAMANAGGYKKGGMMDGGKACATGGVAKANAGGYKDGGMPMKDGKPAFVGDGKGKMKSGGKAMMMGGYATGGVSNSNAGGFKHGGKTSKKAYAAGGTVNSGKPVAMQQGNKPAPAPKTQQNFSGVYKKGGKVAPNNKALQKANDAEYAPTLRAAKADSNLKYGSPKRMQDGGSASKNDEYYVKNPKGISDKASRELEEAMNPFGMVKELYGKARNAFRGQGAVSDREGKMMDEMRAKPLAGQGSVTDKERSMLSKKKESMPPLKGQGAITETERSVTVSPAGKKRGGSAC